MFFNDIECFNFGLAVDDNQFAQPNVGYRLDITAFYDDALNHHIQAHELSPVKEITKIFSLANSYFKDPSLTTPIKLNLINITFVQQTQWDWQADDATIQHLQSETSYFNAESDTHVFFCRPKGNHTKAGKAEQDSVCSDEISRKLAIIEYQADFSITSYILAHLLGHNIGMHHDYYEDGNANRVSSSGSSCSNIGGVMDNARVAHVQHVWSTCSNEDFDKYYNTILKKNKEFCLEKFPSAWQEMREVVDRKVVLPCNINSCHVFGVIWHYASNGIIRRILVHNRVFNETSFSTIQERFKQSEVSLLSSESEVSLVIQKIKRADAGRYICEIRMAKDNPKCKKKQELIVVVKEGNICLLEYIPHLKYDY